MQLLQTEIGGQPGCRRRRKKQAGGEEEPKRAVTMDVSPSFEWSDFQISERLFFNMINIIYRLDEM